MRSTPQLAAPANPSRAPDPKKRSWASGTLRGAFSRLRMGRNDADGSLSASCSALTSNQTSFGTPAAAPSEPLLLAIAAGTPSTVKSNRRTLSQSFEAEFAEAIGRSGADQSRLDDDANPPPQAKLLTPTLSELQQMPSVVLTAFMLERSGAGTSLGDSQVPRSRASTSAADAGASEVSSFDASVTAAPTVLVRLYLGASQSTVLRFSASSTLAQVQARIAQKAPHAADQMQLCVVYEDLEEGRLLLTEEHNAVLWSQLPSVAHLRLVPRPTPLPHPSTPSPLAREPSLRTASDQLEDNPMGPLGPTASVLDPEMIVTPRRDSLRPTGTFSGSEVAAVHPAVPLPTRLNVPLEEPAAPEAELEIPPGYLYSPEWNVLPLLETAPIPVSPNGAAGDQAIALRILTLQQEEVRQTHSPHDHLELVLLVLCRRLQLDYDTLSLHVVPDNDENRADRRIELDRSVAELFSQHPHARLQVVRCEKLYTNHVLTIPGSFFESPEEPPATEHVVLQTRQGRAYVMAASRQMLVACLLSAVTGQALLPSADSVASTIVIDEKTYVAPFFVGFRTYWTPQQLLETLQAMSKAQPHAVLRALRAWVDQCWEDFENDPGLAKQLSAHLSASAAAQPQLVAEIKQMLSVQASLARGDATMGRSGTKRRGKTIESLLLQVEPATLADQLCLHHHAMFQQARATEYIYQVCGLGQSAGRNGHSDDERDEDEGERGRGNAPVQTAHLAQCISRFDLESNWAATEVVQTADLRTRGRVLRRLVAVALGCLDRNNYYSALAILGGLSLQSVQRLRRTWDTLDAASRDGLAGLEQLTNPSKNMRHYRLALSQARLPCIPLLPVDLKDLTFMNEMPGAIHLQASVSGAPSRLVNFDKIRTMFRRVMQARNYTAVSYEGISRNPAVYNYVERPMVISSRQQLSALSLQCESG